MSTPALRADERACVRYRARQSTMDRHLLRFRPELQSRARHLAMRHPRLADLSVSFPALFVALAVPRARFDPAPIIDRVVAGEALAPIAAAARVPFWLRNLEPESFSCALPALPDSLYLRRRIVNHLPKRASHLPLWLDTVGDAAERGTEPFAVWCARLAQSGKKRALRRQNLLSLWAWFCEAPGTRGHTLIERKFSPDMELKSAIASASNWITTASLYLNLGDGPLTDCWFDGGIMDGYEILPLRTADGVAEEGRTMRNCVRTYGDVLASNRGRLWTIRREGVAVATMLTGWRGKDPFPVICQIELPANRKAPAEVWLAARKWLAAQDLTRFDRESMPRAGDPLDCSAWRSFWRPYWFAKGCFPVWLPLGASQAALDEL